MSKTTHVTALCDGAKNCWSVIDALKPLCGSVTCILDWFHVAMKMQNISLPKSLKNKFMRVKWHLWRGNAAHALKRLPDYPCFPAIVNNRLGKGGVRKAM